MSWMFTRIDGMQFVNLRPTMLDDSAWFMPFIEAYMSEKLPWEITGAAHDFEQFPPFEAYEDLTKEFAAQFSLPLGRGPPEVADLTRTIAGLSSM